MPTMVSSFSASPIPPSWWRNPGQRGSYKPSFSSRRLQVGSSLAALSILCAGPGCRVAKAESEGYPAWDEIVASNDFEEIGRKIFHNECSSRDDKLVWWNEVEEFASLGLAHFIWFPRTPTKGQRPPFGESFPALLEFLESPEGGGHVLPHWLTHDRHCPWGSREELMTSIREGDLRVADLRELLKASKAGQVKFIARRLQKALPDMLAVARKEAEERGEEGDAAAAAVEARFYEVATSKGGLYPLIDLVNFKGEGVDASERYDGVGWGLLQALEGMGPGEGGGAGGPRGVPVRSRFASAAFRNLQKRTATPRGVERGEARWLKGWENHCETWCLDDADYIEGRCTRQV